MAQQADASALSVEQLIAMGAHFGRRRSRRHPSCSYAVAATKEGIDIINVAVTLEGIAAAKRALEAAGKEGACVLWVSARAEGRRAVREIAEALGHPFVVRRWLGGTLTNLPEIRKRLKRLLSLRQMQEKGALEQRYTKRERLLLERERRSLEEDFGGLLPLLEREPQMAVVVDPVHTPVAVEELVARRIPFIGLTSTDGNCADIPYPIVCNVGAKPTVEAILQELHRAYQQGANERETSASKTGAREGAGASA